MRDLAAYYATRVSWFFAKGGLINDDHFLEELRYQRHNAPPLLGMPSCAIQERQAPASSKHQGKQQNRRSRHHAKNSDYKLLELTTQTHIRRALGIRPGAPHKK
jgi:hypothetical protein